MCVKHCDDISPAWPSGNPSQVTASSATLQLPAGRAGYELEIIRASQDGSRQTIRSVGSSQPRTQVIDVEGGSSYALGLRWKRLSDNALSGIGGYVTFNTPIGTVFNLGLTDIHVRQEMHEYYIRVI